MLIINLPFLVLYVNFFLSIYKCAKSLSSGHLKVANRLCGELGALASSGSGVEMELKIESSVRHARTLLAAKQFSQVSSFSHF